jgi:ABC-type cobalamin transport system ATPase subunit
MTATPVSLAKLTRPRLHDTVQRERLFALLDELGRRPGLWLTGPPGAGKTTLMASYLAARRLAGWVCRTSAGAMRRNGWRIWQARVRPPRIGSICAS